MPSGIDIRFECMPRREILLLVSQEVVGCKDSDGRPCLTRATKVFNEGMVGDEVDCGTSILQKDLKGKEECGFTTRG